MGKGPHECTRLLLQALAELVLQLGELGPGLQEEGTRVRRGDLADVKARVQALADAVQHGERAHLRARACTACLGNPRNCSVAREESQAHRRERTSAHQYPDASW